MMASEIEIRAMTAEDWPDVRAIYAQGIATGQATFETDAPEWSAWDAAHLAHSRLVAADEHGVRGWAALSPVSKRRVYAGVAEVSVYVAESAQGRGVGRALLGAVIAASGAQGIWTLQASVFPENAASIGLMRSAGFRIVGTRERIGRMDGVWRDTVLMERRSAVAGVDGTGKHREP